MNDQDLTEYEEDELADAEKKLAEEEEEEEEEDEEETSNSKKKLGLECQLFDWDGWDDSGVMCPLFYKVELLVPIGEFPVGHKFPVAFFNGDDSNITFCDENDNHYTYQLILTTGNKIKEVA